MNPESSLKRNSDFRRVYARGKSAASQRVVVYSRKNRMETNRTGFTVSKKLGNAVIRNRVRRRLREIVRLNNPTFRQGYDIIVVARSRAVDSEYHKLEEDVLHCYEQLHLIRKDVTE